MARAFVRVWRSGESIVIVIPKPILETFPLAEGDRLLLATDDQGGVRISKEERPPL